MISESKPKNIVELLFLQRAGANKELLVKTNAKGKITEILGNYLLFSPEGLKPGIPITEAFPFLSPFFPVAHREVVNLPAVNLGKLYVSVQMFYEENRDVWILFSDVTREVNEVKDFIQQNNDLALKQKTVIKHPPLDNPFGNLHLFGVVTFLKTNNNNLVCLGETPSWLMEYFPQLALAKSETELFEIFPYLEVFLPAAGSFWETGKEEMFGSDMWIETPVDNNELFFRAFVTNKNGNHYLMVRLLDKGDISVNQQTVQRARDQQLIYEKLEKAEKELKKLLNYKDKFVSIVSHDLRSPMASVVSIAELLLTDKQLVSTMSEFNLDMLRSMKEELLRLLEYNNRLYHWANLELGNFKLDREKTTIRKLIDSVSQTAKPKIEAKNIRFLSLVPEDFEIEVDVSLFTQALNNLIGNAIKFTPETGQIEIKAKQENGKAQVVVSDTGVGMPPKVQQSVFSGVPNESTLGTSGEKGSGLGLDIVKKIMDAHGFNIAVQSEVGKGTMFIINLIN